MNKKIKEENIKLFNRLKDCKDLQEKKYLEEELFILNQKLIWVVIKRIGYRENNLMSEDDYFSIGSQGLINAIRNFDVDKYKNFSTYAYPCIFNEIGTEMRKINKIMAKEISLQSSVKRNVIGSREKENVIYEDILFSDYDTIEKSYNTEREESILKIVETKLNKDKQIYIKDYYGLCGAKNKTYQEIAEENNVSRPAVSIKSKEARDRIKYELMKKYTEDELKF